MQQGLILSVLLVAIAGMARAESLTVQPVAVTDWKAVYARIEARDRVPARARIGGVLVELSVSEGDAVAEGQPIARIVDDKLAFQLAALESQKAAVAAQLANARAEVTRGEELLKQGVTTAQRLDALRTQADVLAGQLAAIEAQAQVTKQSQTEGVVLAPAGGRVLDVPVSKGAVVMAGEAVATLAVGGSFLRLAVPERLAGALHEGDAIRIEGIEGGKLAKVYPLIENGRVVADVEVPDLPDGFVDARVLVRLPVGHHAALMVPEAALVTRDGLDFVGVEGAEGVGMRVVVPGLREGGQVEILTGLVAGDRIVTDAGAADE